MAPQPCPCGYLGDRRRPCACTPAQVQRYRKRLSGPLLDRIDLHVEAPSLTVSELRGYTAGESSAAIAARIQAAWERQARRNRGTPPRSNARMTHADLRRFCALETSHGDLLQDAMERLGLSARAYDRILKVSRTIADLADSGSIAPAHLMEAIQYRSLDRSCMT